MNHKNKSTAKQTNNETHIFVSHSDRRVRAYLYRLQKRWITFIVHAFHNTHYYYGFNIITSNKFVIGLHVRWRRQVATYGYAANRAAPANKLKLNVEKQGI